MLQPGTELQGRYQIVRLLGRGGMGAVYEARDVRLDSPVAVKDCRFDEPELVRQFEREARLLARLRHPAVTRVIDHFSEGDANYLVMEFIPGDDLHAMMLKGARFTPEQVIGWTDQLLEALDYLHSQQHPVIHRDIKPANLKLMPHGQIILLDFGLAKGSTGQTTAQTGPKSVYGYTPNYAPIEQIHGTEGTDARSDLYSLAATMYHLLTGTMPPGTLLRLSKTSDGVPDPLQPAHVLNPAVPVAVSEVFSRALSISRDRRPSSAKEMRAMLRQAATDAPVVSAPPGEARDNPPSISAAAAVPPSAVSSPPPSSPRKSRTALAVVVVLLVLLAVAIASAVILLRRGSSTGEPILLTATVAHGTGTGEVKGTAGALKSASGTSWGRGQTASTTGQTGGALTVLKGHTTSVRNVAFSPDGATVASASSDGTARLWDVASRRERLVIRREGMEVTSVAFSRDGKMLAVGGYSASGSNIGFFDPATGRPVRDELIDRSDLVSDVLFAADGRFVAAIGTTIHFWDLRKGEQVLAIAAGVNPVIATSPDGSLTAVGGSNEKSANLYSRSGQGIKGLHGHEQGILSVAFNPDGRTVATGSYDSAVRIWRVDSSEDPRVLKLDDLDKPFALAYSPDGAVLAAATEDLLRLWNVRDGSERARIDSACLGYAVAWSPSGKTIAVGCSSGDVKLYAF